MRIATARNYRFIIAAFAVIMVILLVGSSSKKASVSKAKFGTPGNLKPPVQQNFDGSVVNNVDSGLDAQQDNVGSTSFGDDSKVAPPPVPQSPLDDDDEEYDEFKTLPVDDKPGFIDDGSTAKGNPAVNQAVKNTQSGGNSLKDTTGQASSCGKDHQFVVMIDAGSSGSRVHVYEFDVCSQPPTLVRETFEKVQPGLSKYEDNPTAGAKSLDVLLEKALEVIPEKSMRCSPVAVKATAGLRKLGEESAHKILSAVRAHLEDNYPFPIVEDEGVSIMSGEQEGVYAWITTNYLLGNIGAGSKIPTSAIFDLGGGSTQIVFEPSFEGNEKMVDGEHKHELTFGEQKYTLYQFSHLGYGLNEARKQINSRLVQKYVDAGRVDPHSREPITLQHACLAPNENLIAEEVTLKSGDVILVNFEGVATANPKNCKNLIKGILNKGKQCTQKPCSFNGVHQPSLVHTFKETNDMYAFSYFFDKTNPLNMPEAFTVQELIDLAATVCGGEEVWAKEFSDSPEAMRILKKEPTLCMDLTYEASLLHDGYDIPLTREIKTTERIDNKEIGWCLGASLPLLDGSNWKCKVKEIE
ncbi:hypothetical protein Kpol_1059p16 [Vanderwaltozyma polyspora DSM 70294]|uniref:guanosine-diphosphatase n=1 Tax=Vanderwaltozyma polyspora (strain ATCC 22028 / DSM 70294 / BCRC 21397 / CBS 2163 / NBRC 10782 / NRRL Y-8283 / UCD 57-17) TaxID=436907 RepID=A7TN20_VANPO|nr:uncharacterized protein Kpol_1059p16 [Vanderwaltozyma polyspora DSM 70294]EDO16326.1 hypothetical protein Kpol_1059p16 [Vanderwaltozyma polyspora DSM 70294]